MKRMISLLLVLTMVAAVFAGCGSKQSAGDTTGAAVVEPKSALEMLETVWGLYADNEKFAVMGGDEMVMDAPGAVAMGGAENPLWTLYVPDDQLANITEAATMVHAMNLNTFTSGVVKLADGADVKAFAQTMRDTILNTQWMCGFPEKLIVANIGSYVLIAFGMDGISFPDDGALMTTFKTHLQEAYADASILFEEDLLK